MLPSLFVLKTLKKANDFMHSFKEVLTVDSGQLPIFPDNNFEYDYNVVDLLPHNVYKY